MAHARRNLHAGFFITTFLVREFLLCARSFILAQRGKKPLYAYEGFFRYAPNVGNIFKKFFLRIKSRVDFKGTLETEGMPSSVPNKAKRTEKTASIFF